MALTKAQIKERAATRLGIVAIGQALSHEDGVRLEQAYNEVYEYLKTHGIASFAASSDVPSDIAPYFITMIAHNCIDDYKIPNELYQRIAIDFSQAEHKIRALVIPDYISTTQPTGY